MTGHEVILIFYTIIQGKILTFLPSNGQIIETWMEELKNSDDVLTGVATTIEPAQDKPGLCAYRLVLIFTKGMVRQWPHFCAP